MNRKSLNYLDLIPVRNKNISYSTENGIVKLYIKNKGFFHYITQKLCKKPTVSTIELEEIGSCIWQSIDEKNDVFTIGQIIKDKFGSDIEPLYERLYKYFKILEITKLITIKPSQFISQNK